MRRRTSTWLILAALAGCSTPAERPPAPAADTSRTSDIENRRWVLVELNDEPVEIVNDGEPMYFELDSEQSRITGNARCNRFFGGYEISAGYRLLIGPNLGSTRRACPGLELEQAFLAMLGQIDSYAIAEGMLELQRAGATLARFRGL